MAILVAMIFFGLTVWLLWMFGQFDDTDRFSYYDDDEDSFAGRMNALIDEQIEKEEQESK